MWFRLRFGKICIRLGFYHAISRIAIFVCFNLFQLKFIRFKNCIQYYSNSITNQWLVEMVFKISPKTVNVFNSNFFNLLSYVSCTWMIFSILNLWFNFIIYFPLNQLFLIIVLSLADNLLITDWLTLSIINPPVLNV